MLLLIRVFFSPFFCFGAGGRRALFSSASQRRVRRCNPKGQQHDQGLRAQQRGCGSQARARWRSLCAVAAITTPTQRVEQPPCERRQRERGGQPRRPRRLVGQQERSGGRRRGHRSDPVRGEHSQHEDGAAQGVGEQEVRGGDIESERAGNGGDARADGGGGGGKGSLLLAPPARQLLVVGRVLVAGSGGARLR